MAFLKNNRLLSSISAATGNIVLFGLAYFLLALLGKWLSFQPSNFANFWLPSGLFVGALLLTKPNLWPGYVLAAFVANLAFDLIQGQRAWVSLLFFTGNSLEALTGAWLTRRYFGTAVRLDSLRYILGFTLISPVISTCISATIGASVLSVLYPTHPFGDNWRVWWIADSLGIMVMAPGILAWFGQKIHHQPRLRPLQILELLVIFAGLLVMTWLSYGVSALDNLDLDELIIPFMLWAAIRYGPPGSASANLSVALLTVGFIVHRQGSGGAVDLPVVDQAHAIQIFLSGSILVSLVLASTSAERKKAEKTLQESERRFRALTENSRDLIYRYTLYPTPGFDYVSPSATEMTGYTPEEHLADPYLGQKLVHPDDLDRLNALASSPELLKQPQVFRWIRKDGTILWVEQVNVPIYDETGRMIALEGRSRDITEKILQEEILRESERKYRNFVDQSSEGILLTDEEGTIIEANRVIEELSGIERKQAMGMKVWEFQYHLATPEQRMGIQPEDLKPKFEQVLQTGQSPLLDHPIESRYQKQNGETRHVQQVLFAIKTASGYRLGGSVRDITYRMQMEEALKEANRRLYVSLSDLNAYQDQLLEIDRLNDMLQVCLTIEEAYRVIGLSLQNLFPGQKGYLAIVTNSARHLECVASWGCDPSSEKLFPIDSCWAMRHGQVHEIEDTSTGLICKHSEADAVAASICVPLVVQGETLGLFYLGQTERLNPEQAGVQRQLALNIAKTLKLALANIRLRETLRDQSIRDPLTGLYNRRFMEEALTREIYRAKKNEGTLGVIMADLDHFKRFNDIHGHRAGDLMLREMGKFIKKCLRPEAIACRYGGEEFILIVPGADQAIMREIAEQICADIRGVEIVYSEAMINNVTASIGIALFPEHAENVEQLVLAADMALLQAKENGRDQVMVATARAKSPSGNN